jgi:chromosome segregation ATPase
MEDTSTSTGTKKRRADGPALQERLNEMQSHVHALKAQVRNRDAALADMQRKLHAAEAELEMADERIRDLQMSMFDLQESNSNYAVSMQQKLLSEQNMRNHVRLLQEELLQFVHVHHKQMTLLKSERVEVVHERTAACGICQEASESYDVLMCKHAMCTACSRRLATCPYCRDEVVVVHSFVPWW